MHTYTYKTHTVDKKQLATQLCAGQFKVFKALTVIYVAVSKFTIASHVATYFL